MKLIIIVILLIYFNAKKSFKTRECLEGKKRQRESRWRAAACGPIKGPTDLLLEPLKLLEEDVRSNDRNIQTRMVQPRRARPPTAHGKSFNLSEHCNPKIPHGPGDGEMRPPDARKIKPSANKTWH